MASTDVGTEFSHSGQGAVRADIWAKGFGTGFLLVAPVLVLGLTWQEENISNTASRDNWDEDVAFQVFLPALLWYIISIILTGKVAYMFGKDMLQESSSDMKDCVRSNMTTAGVVLALVLSIVLGMLQTGLSFNDSNARVAMWYRVFLVLATEACIKGILSASFFLVYMEPLSPKAAMVFTLDNINYLGEPVTCVVWSLLYFLFAMALWMFGVDGMYMGVFASVVLCFVIVRTVVVMMYCNSWKNHEIPEDERRKRMEVMTDAAAPKKKQKK